jgi:hypothetical protein
LAFNNAILDEMMNTTGMNTLLDTRT